MKQTARGLLRILRPYDYLIIFLLIVGSFLPLVLFQAQAQSQTGDRYAVIRINGQEVDRFNLDTLSTLEKTYYPAQGQYNIIEIDDGRIRVKEDNSPDQIAVKTGWISKNGQTSICLPHKLVIEIKQSGAENYFIY
ncbi:NusG domain II-containing protein [Enterococcus sp.]|uniref:NusG domain II-containing protein n=1 Tax=Enterococcus sp. TaxID=35783 RepID=UPI00289F35DB|nr:NusG domain II-containing protein [Enterococcus sp.]